MGAVFTVGIVLMYVVGVPHAHLLAAITVPVGVIVGIVLYFWHKHRPVEVIDIDPPDKS